MYTTTIQVDGVQSVSRYFHVLGSARNWFEWLKSQKFVEAAKLYRGEAGAEVLESYERDAPRPEPKRSIPVATRPMTPEQAAEDLCRSYGYGTGRYNGD